MLSVAFPWLAIDGTGLVIYGAFGAFDGMYGRNESCQVQVIHQGHAAVLIVGGTVLSVGVAAVHIGPLAPVAGVVSIVADKCRLRPGDLFFCIFALGACTCVPLAVSWLCTALSYLGSAHFAVLMGFARWVGSRNWVPGAGHPEALAISRAIPLHCLRYLLTVGAAGAAGILRGAVVRAGRDYGL